MQDIYRIKDWNAVTAVLAGGNVGACRVMINLFRTTASAMINGRDAEALYDNVRQMLEIVADSKKASILRQMRAVFAQSEDSEQNPSPEAVSIMPVTSTHDPKSEQNARIICITCETPVAQASD